MTCVGNLPEVASCAFCHGPNGSGGFKLSWRPIGTLWVRNITRPRDGDGLSVSIARAIWRPHAGRPRSALAGHDLGSRIELGRRRYPRACLSPQDTACAALHPGAATSPDDCETTRSG